MSILPDGSPLSENPAWDDPEGHGDGSSPLSDAMDELRLLIADRKIPALPVTRADHWSARAAQWVYFYADVIVEAFETDPTRWGSVTRAEFVDARVAALETALRDTLAHMEWAHYPNHGVEEPPDAFDVMDAARAALAASADEGDAT